MNFDFICKISLEFSKTGITFAYELRLKSFYMKKSSTRKVTSDGDDGDGDGDGLAAWRRSQAVGGDCVKCRYTYPCTYSTGFNHKPVLKVPKYIPFSGENLSGKGR